MISAEIAKGRQDPNKGFATANIKTPIGLGAYICRTNYGDGLAAGVRPNELEVHIIGFDGDIYGQTLEITELKEIDKEWFMNMFLRYSLSCFCPYLFCMLIF